MKIGIISIGYDEFDFDKFYKNLDNFFLPTHNKTFYFFTNKTEYIYKSNVNVYFSKNHLGIYSNIQDVIEDARKDKIQLLFFCNLDRRFTLTTGTLLIPDDAEQYSSLNKDNDIIYYNFPALLEHIKGNEHKMIYGSYLENFIYLIKYLVEREFEDKNTEIKEKEIKDTEEIKEECEKELDLIINNIK